MRAVNLIPAEERKGESAPMRTGPVVYLIVGVLALALVGVTATTLLSKSIAEKQEELASLERQEAAASARAAALQPFVEFEAVKAARQNTVSKLATSRFDWERVMRELALVLPTRVWLTDLSGSVVGEAADEGTEGGAITGPSLKLVGCARSQRGVARLVTSLEDIDGVTRVLADNAEKGAGGGGGGAEAGGGGGDGGNCQTRDFVAKFNVTVAFDEVVIDPDVLPPVPPGVPETDGGVEQPAAATEEVPAGEDGVASAQSQREAGADSVDEADERAGKAKNLASGGSK